MNLSGANLRGANLNRADLSGANLIEAELIRTNLGEAELNEANLIRTNLGGADLCGAHLDGTHLYWAYCGEADLSGAHLLGVNLRGAIVDDVTFGKIDLSEVEGLDTVEHRGPSTIGLDTLQRSKGQIPEVFLRGCGLSDWEIENAKLYNPDLTQNQIIDITYKISNLLTDKALQFYSCFISYSSKDVVFAQRLHNDLQNSGVRCWFAPEDMKIGAKIRPTIDHSIRVHDKLLLILSENSIHSNWVEKEVETAFEEEDQRKQTILFPIRLDKTVMETDQAWAADIRRTRHIGDFSPCDDDEVYQRGFARLLRDLQVSEETPSD